MPFAVKTALVLPLLAGAAGLFGLFKGAVAALLTTLGALLEDATLDARGRCCSKALASLGMCC